MSGHVEVLWWQVASEKYSRSTQISCRSSGSVEVLNLNPLALRAADNASFGSSVKSGDFAMEIFFATTVDGIRTEFSMYLLKRSLIGFGNVRRPLVNAKG